MQASRHPPFVLKLRRQSAWATGPGYLGSRHKFQLGSRLSRGNMNCIELPVFAVAKLSLYLVGTRLSIVLDVLVEVAE